MEKMDLTLPTMADRIVLTQLSILDEYGYLLELPEEEREVVMLEICKEEIMQVHGVGITDPVAKANLRLHTLKHYGFLLEKPEQDRRDILMMLLSMDVSDTLH